MYRKPVYSGPRRALALSLFLALAATTLSAQANQWYVDAGVKSPGSGKSWAAAFATLPAALSAATSGDTVRVAAGTYMGGFALPSGVTLLGGFRPGMVNDGHRRPLHHLTILDGEGKQRVLQLGATSVLDGFVVQNGKAGSPGGGGILIDTGAPTVRNSLIRLNTNSGGRGAAMLVRSGATPRVENCVFTQNKGPGHVIDVDGAGGIYVHLTVHDNEDNGLHFINTSSPQVFNCIFSSNTGRGMCHISAKDQPVVENNLFHGNRIAPYHYRGSDLKTVVELNQLGYAAGNLAGDPDYLETTRFFLGANSAAVDQGRDRNDFPIGDIHLDQRGHDDARRSGPGGYRDIGAVEWQGSALTQGGSTSPGGTITFSLTAPSDGGLVYQVGSAFGDGPIAIDTRRIRLGVDPLLQLTLGGQVPQVFAGYAGRLDNAGKATASVHVPNDSALKGLTLHTAFVTLSGAAPSGVRTISDSLRVRIN